uniref:Uncharacterized protein n=1 Tax=Rhizophagus irregularis (strain DAOM 181602 / DAOM 197198 / MUCL 43194) TaxID=747089 RepID=U9USM2_RHIID
MRRRYSRIQLQRKHRYFRNSAPMNSAQMWTPIFQEFSSGMDTEFQDKISVSAWILNPKGILAPTWILKSQRKIGSYLDTESQR